MAKRKKKAAGGGGSAGGAGGSGKAPGTLSPASASRSRTAARTGGKQPTPKGVTKPPTTKAQKDLTRSERSGGGGFRGTFFQANRPTSGRRSTRTPRTPSGRTFDQAARERIAAAQSARGGRGPSGDIFEILIKTYAEDRRDELANAFLEVLIEEIPVGATGVLVDSAHIEDIGETAYTATATVVVDAPYAQWVNDGSDAVENTLMVWDAEDGTVFAMSRQAIPPNPFWDRALARWSEVVASV